MDPPCVHSEETSRAEAFANQNRMQPHAPAIFQYPSFTDSPQKKKQGPVNHRGTRSETPEAHETKCYLGYGRLPAGPADCVRLLPRVGAEIPWLE